MQEQSEQNRRANSCASVPSAGEREPLCSRVFVWPFVHTCVWGPMFTLVCGLSSPMGVTLGFPRPAAPPRRHLPGRLRPHHSPSPRRSHLHHLPPVPPSQLLHRLPPPGRHHFDPRLHSSPHPLPDEVPPEHHHRQPSNPAPPPPYSPHSPPSPRSRPGIPPLPRPPRRAQRHVCVFLRVLVRAH